jgi:hypothetical protein
MFLVQSNRNEDKKDKDKEIGILKKEMKKLKEQLYSEEYKMALKSGPSSDGFTDLKLLIEKTQRIPELAMVLDIISQKL